MQIQKSRESNFYFPETILKQFRCIDLSILAAHNFGVQIQGLVNYCQ